MGHVFESTRLANFDLFWFPKFQIMGPKIQVKVLDKEIKKNVFSHQFSSMNSSK